MLCMCQVAKPYKAAERKCNISEEYFYMEASKLRSPKGFELGVVKLKPLVLTLYSPEK